MHGYKIYPGGAFEMTACLDVLGGVLTMGAGILKGSVSWS